MVVFLSDTILRVDLGALAANYRAIGDRVFPATVAAVVKADAYGLGAVKIAQTLAQLGCRDFFVAKLIEAQRLKPSLPRVANLYILNGLQPDSEEVCAALGAIPVINSIDQLRRWSELARRLGRNLPGVLQIDSGMSRLGLPEEELAQLSAPCSPLKNIDMRLIMSHLACADDPGALFNAEQRRRFEALTAPFPGIPRSLDNSGGGFLPWEHLDLVRAGIALYGAVWRCMALYGASPTKGPNPMQPVLSLETQIIQLRNLPAGAAVGYGSSFVCAHSCQVATIPVGYADGWPRHLSNRGAAYISGIRAPIVGRVSMDSTTLDVSAVPDSLLYPGAPVELLGPSQSLDDVAADAGAISYEILTQLGSRYRREYIARPERTNIRSKGL